MSSLTEEIYYREGGGLVFCKNCIVHSTFYKLDRFKANDGDDHFNETQQLTQADITRIHLDKKPVSFRKTFCGRNNFVLS